MKTTIQTAFAINIWGGVTNAKFISLLWKRAIHQSSNLFLNLFKIIGIMTIIIISSEETNAQCGTLPTSLPTNAYDLAMANQAIACTFAPTLHQMTDNSLSNSANGVADLIVDIYYDGDQDTRNNWDNMTNYDINNPALNPKVYYSVIWFSNHWIVTYAFYHARDYAGQGLCCGDNHENDMEGAVYVIDRVTNSRIFGGALSHKFLLEKCTPDNLVFIDDGTHANRLGAPPYVSFFPASTTPSQGPVDCIADYPQPCDPCKSFSNPHIIYTRGNNASQSLTRNGNNISGTASYILEDVFTSNPNGLWSKKLSPPNNVIWGDIFAHNAPFQNHDCQNSGTANPPWGWHDQFDHSINGMHGVFDLMTKAAMCQPMNTYLIHNPYTNQSLPLCSAPQSLVISSVTDFTATLDWNNVPGATFYRIYYKKNTETQWQETSSTQSIITLNNLDPNTAYDFRVASNCNMTSLYSSFTTTCIVCSCVKNDIIVNSNQTLNTSNVTGDIYVKAGYTLTINNLVKFNIGSSIIIEQGARLIVNGGTLTSCYPNYKWDGILVWGNPTVSQGFPSTPWFTSGGVVEIKGGSILENALVGINTSNPTSGGFFGNFNWSGGLVKVENSILRKCNIGVNFGPYGYTSPSYSLEDQSFFNNATFLDCNYGVKIDNNIGVEFDASTFTGLSYAIESFNSKIDVDNNTSINGSVSGISFYNTWPTVLGSSIKNSSFSNDFDVVWESSGNATPYVIQSNNFNGYSAILGYGLSRYEITNNQYNNNAEGITTWETGNAIGNFVTNNYFNSNQYATSIVGLNNQEYNGNCFAYSVVSAIELVGASTSIFNQQGDGIDAANNCFVGPAKHVTTDIGTIPFEYFIKNTTPIQDCKHPGFGGNFYLNANFNSNQPDFECGNIYGYSSMRVEELPLLLSAKLLLENAEIDKLDKIKEDKKLTENEKIKLNAHLKRNLKKLNHAIIVQKIKEEGNESAISYALSRPDFDLKIIGYGIIAGSGNLERASKTVKELPTLRAEEGDFQTAQNLYLDYLKNKKDFILSKQDRQKLEKIAKAQNELSGFARSIFYQLTGEKIKIKFEHLKHTTERSLPATVKTENSVKVYPNPILNAEFNIVINQNSISLRDFSYEIIDITGKKQASNILHNGVNKISIERTGIYILKVYENNKVVHQEKLIKL